MRNLFIALLFLSIINLSAQSSSRIVGPFDELIVSGKLNVLIVQGDSESVEIYEEGYSEGDVNVNLRNGVLKVSSVDGWMKKGNRRIPVRISYKYLHKIRVSAGAELQSEQTIVADQFEIKAGSGAEVELKIEVKTLEAGASEGAILKLYGQAENQYVTTYTGGEYEGEGLECANTHVKSNTGGQARVVANNFLDAVANTGGGIRYSGSPGEKHTKSNLGGDIRRY